MIGNSPAPRWVMDTASCGVFLGDEKMLASRKVLIG
jgi:hypothetical protein